MRYTEAVIREALRVRPIIGAALRSAAREFELDGHLVRQGMLLNVGFAQMAHNDSR